MKDASSRALNLEDEKLSRLSRPLTGNSSRYPHLVVTYHLPQSTARENGDEDATGYRTVYTYILVFNHVLPRSLQDNVSSNPPHPRIPYRTRSNRSTALAYVRAVFVVLSPPAMGSSKLSCGSVNERCFTSNVSHSLTSVSISSVISISSSALVAAPGFSLPVFLVAPPTSKGPPSSKSSPPRGSNASFCI